MTCSTVMPLVADRASRVSRKSYCGDSKYVYITGHAALSGHLTGISVGALFHFFYFFIWRWSFLILVL